MTKTKHRLTDDEKFKDLVDNFSPMAKNAVIKLLTGKGSELSQKELRLGEAFIQASKEVADKHKDDGFNTTARDIICWVIGEEYRPLFDKLKECD